MAANFFLLLNLTLALCAVASPIQIRDSLVTLPLVKRLKANSTLRLLERDQRRALVLKDRGTSPRTTRAESIPAINEAVSYMVEVSISLLVNATAAHHAVNHRLVLAHHRRSVRITNINIAAGEE